MKRKKGGYWAKVPSIPGCATQGETFDGLLGNIYKAVEGCLRGYNVEVNRAGVSRSGPRAELSLDDPMQMAWATKRP